MNIFNFAKQSSQIRELPKFDVKRIAAELAVHRRAQAATPPHVMPTASTLDSNEERFLEYHSIQVAEGCERLDRQIVATFSAVRHLCETPEPNFQDARELAEQALEKHKLDRRQSLIDLARIIAAIEDEIRAFKLKHGLRRDPRLPEGLSVIFAGFGVAILGEAACNMATLSAGLRGGLLEGFLTAAVLAGANLAVGLGAGFGVRELLHTHPYRKALGAAALGAYLVTLCAWAVLLGYYREALIAHPDAAGASAVRMLKQFGPAGAFGSVQGVLLVGVTIGFGVAAMLSVFVIREPYPSYHELGQRIRAARGRAGQLRQAYLDGVGQGVQPLERAVMAHIEKWTDSRKALVQGRDTLELLVRSYHRFLERAATSLRGISSDYRRMLTSLTGTAVSSYEGSFDFGEPLNLAPTFQLIEELEEIVKDKDVLTRVHSKAEVALAAIRGAARTARNEADAFFAQCGLEPSLVASRVEVPRLTARRLAAL